MDNFRSAIKQRIIWLVILNVLALTFIIVTGLYSNSSNGLHVSEFIRGFQAGILMVLQAFLLFITVRYFLAYRNAAKLKALKITENDERAKLIRDKIGGGGFNFTLAAAAVGAVIAGFFNETVFFTLAAVLFFMANVKFSLKIYYNLKY